MTLPDVNCLVYAIDKLARHHTVAKNWLEQAFASAEPLALAWPVVLGFVRITTHPAIMDKPLRVGDACGLINEWLSLPGTRLIHPTEQTFALFFELLKQLGSGGNLSTDALIAAMAIEHDATVFTYDLDFQRIPQVRTATPAP
ncbi:MAG: TA system VapC family ribonuclease toxin [Opitutales bacterium]